MAQRYARQQLLSGWEQQRLTDATIAIVGSGSLAFLAGLMAASMGFGRLVMLGADRPEAVKISLEGSWSELYRRINPHIRVYAATTRLSLALLRRLPALDGLVVAGNDLEAHGVACKAVRELSIPVVAGATAGRLGVWGRAELNPVLIRLCAHREFPLLSQVVAGLLVEEMRKALLPLAGEAGTTDQVNYLRLPLQRASSQQWRRPRSSAPRSLVVVGAGALGTWFGLALGMTGLSAALHLYDDDEVSETNLNRQVIHRADAVGRWKADSAAAGSVMATRAAAVRERFSAVAARALEADASLAVRIAGLETAGFESSRTAAEVRQASRVSTTGLTWRPEVRGSRPACRA